MTRFDRHVATVQTRLFLRRLAESLSWALVVVALGAALLVAIDRLFAVALPAGWWPWVLGIAVLFAVKVSVIIALVGRATPAQAAAAIDASLGLKERFSTAVFARPSTDPFARAAVQDAETTAEHVDLGRRFAISVPRRTYAAGAVAIVTLAAALFAPRADLIGRRAIADARARDAAARVEARANISRALAVVSAAPSWRNEEELDRLVDDLKGLATLPEITDPAAANRKALRAIELAQAPVADRAPNPRGDGAASDKPPTGKPAVGGHEATADETNAKAADRQDDAAGGATGSTNAADPSAQGGNAANAVAGNRPVVAGDRLKPDAAPQPGAGKQAGADPGAGAAAAAGNPNAQPNGAEAAGQPGADNQPAGANGANGKPADGNGAVANNAAGGGVAPGGDRPKATAPFSVVPEKSPSQDVEGGRILARDLVPAPAKPGESKVKATDAATAARQALTDEVDAEHVSGPAPAAARRYFRTTSQATTPPAK